MFKTIKPFVAVSMALAAGLANATDIGFSGLSAKSFSASYEENSYLMTPTVADDLIGYKSVAGKALESSGFTFTADGGGSFELKSLDVDMFDANKVKLSYTLEDGTSKMMNLATGVTPLDIDDVVSFTLSGKAGSKAADFLVDDIRVKADGAVSAVPEPSSMTLMFAGLGIFATLVRRRRA